MKRQFRLYDNGDWSVGIRAWDFIVEIDVQDKEVLTDKEEIEEFDKVMAKHLGDFFDCSVNTPKELKEWEEHEKI